MLATVASESSRARAIPPQVALHAASPARSPSRRRCRCPSRCRRRPARQRGRVVDAVAGHRDAAALALQPLTRAPPCPRAAPRRAPRRCRASRATAFAVVMPVAGRHHDAQARLAQRGDRLRRRFLDRIGDRDRAREACRRSARNTTVAPSARSASAARAQRRSHRPRLRASARVAQQRRACPSTVPRTPMPVGDSKSAALRRARASAARFGHDRVGQRMLAALVEARREAQHLVLGDAGAAPRRCETPACRR